MRVGVVGISVLLAAECAMSFAAGVYSLEAVQACRAKETVTVEEIGIRGAWYKFTGGAHMVKSAVEDSLTAEMLVKALPMQIVFERRDGLLMSQMPVALLAGEKASSLAAGDFLYMPGERRLAIVVDPEKAPKDGVLLGHLGKEAADTLIKEETWTLTLGR